VRLRSEGPSVAETGTFSQGFDENGQVIDRTVSGFHARVVQHECDHLIGVLYPMRIRDFSRFGFTDVLFPDQEMADD